MAMTRDFKIDIGQMFKDDKRDIIITDREYRRKELKPDKKGRTYYQDEKWYKYTCNVCGWTEGWIKEGSLLEGNGCSCCYGRTAVLGINTIWDTDRWMCDLGVSEEDAKKYTKASNSRISITCPNCNKIKNIRIRDMYSDKSNGCICGDRISYPEKFITSILTQLNVNFKTQLTNSTFKWCGDKRYDFYLLDYNAIIETHGMQHYEQRTRGKPLEEEQKNDRIKKDLALNNGIEHYIELDCRYSDLEWIKNSCIVSMSVLFENIKDVDFDRADRFAISSNKVKDVCLKWSSDEDLTIINIAKIFDISTDTVTSYLKRGNKLGWCEYDPKKNKIKTAMKTGLANGIKIEIFKNDISLGVFNSAREIDRQSESILGVKLVQSMVSKAVRENKCYKGYNFVALI